MNENEMKEKDKLTNELIDNLEKLKNQVKSYKENGENLEKVSTSLEQINALIQSLSQTNNSLKELSKENLKNNKEFIKKLDESLFQIKKYFLWLIIIILIILGINLYDII